MRTYNLEEAAKLLCMSPSTLRAKAKSGEVRASKPAKCWVFLEEDLIAYLDAKANLVAANAISPVVELCQSIDVAAPTGFASQRQMASEYADRLGLTTSGRRRNSTIG